MEDSPDVLVHGFFKRFRQERLVADDEVRVGCPGTPSGGLQPLLESTGSMRPVRRRVNSSKVAIWLQL